MAKNKQVIYLVPPNKYAGGSFLSGLGAGFKDAFAKPDWKSMGQGAAGGLINGAATMVGGLAGSAIGGGLESGAGQVVDQVANLASAIPGPWGAVAGAGLKVVGGLVNRAFGSKLNQENINKANQNINQMNSFTSNAGSFDALSKNMSEQPAAMGFTQSDIGKDGWFSRKAKRKYRELREKQRKAALWVENSLANNADNLRESQGMDSLANFAAFGGPIFMPITGAIDYEVAQRRLAQQDLADKNTGRSVPQFYALGGPLQAYGGDWTNGITIVDAGGSHEENPFEGVQMGTDQEGKPNLVEEGEVIYKNYVFSNRLHVPDAVRQKYKLRGTKDMTFADAARKAQKPSAERPNDPIEMRGLEDIMGKLMYEQEQVRSKRNGGPQGVMYSHGGCLGTLFDGDGSGSQFLQFYTPAEKFARQYGPKISLGTQPIEPYFIPGTSIRRKPTLNTADLSFTVPPLVDERTPSQRWIDDNIKPVTLQMPSTTSSTDDETGTESPVQKTKSSWLTGLRYLPALGAGIGVFSDLMGWTNKPDYSNADSVLGSVSGLRDVAFKPIGDYMTYRPLDRLFYANQLGAQAGATRRGILSSSGLNRGQAMAGLLAADYNAQTQLGNLFRQAEEFNLSQREKVATFNRATNMFNSEQDLKAQIANKNNEELKLKAATTAASLRDAVDARVGAARSANLTNLFNSLGDIGREEFQRNMVNSNRAQYYSISRDGTITYKGDFFNLGTTDRAAIKATAEAEAAAITNKKAYGGCLTIKPRRR